MSDKYMSVLVTQDDAEIVINANLNKLSDLLQGIQMYNHESEAKSIYKKLDQLEDVLLRTRLLVKEYVNNFTEYEIPDEECPF